MFLNIYYWEKMAFSKLVGKVNFLEKKALRSKSYKVIRYSFILVLLSSDIFRLQNRVSDFF